MEDQIAEQLREKRKAKRVDNAAKGIVKEPSAPATAPATEAATSGDPVADFAKQLIDAMGLDSAKGTVLFKNSLKKWTEKQSETLEQTMKRAIASGNNGGHRYSRWFRANQATYSQHLPQHAHNFYTNCTQCKAVLRVRMNPPLRGPNQEELGKELKATYSGRSLKYSCLRLQGLKAQSLQKNEFAAIENR